MRLLLCFIILSLFFSCGTSPTQEAFTPPERIKSEAKHGEWVSRRDDGTIKTRVNYNNGVKDGMSFLYYADGKTIQLQLPYQAGKRQGTSVKYFEDGSIYAETNYQNDVLHGVRTTYYRNGQIKSKISYRAGLPGSDLEEYYKSGNRKESLQITYSQQGNSLQLAVAPDCSDKRYFFGGLDDSGFFDESATDTELFPESGQFSIDLNEYTPSYLQFQDLVCMCKSSQGNPVLIKTRVRL